MGGLLAVPSTGGSSDWLTRFVEWTFPFGEAPEHVYWWTGLATISAVLRRRCWLDRGTYVLYPNLNVMFVAPPAVIAKSTTLDRGANLLRGIEEVHLGPETSTWQALYKKFDDIKQTFTYKGEELWESPLACFVSEIGTFIDAMDKQSLLQLINFWDGKAGEKITLTNGSFDPVKPLISIIGCTTPDWFESSFDQRAVKGGFMSRFLLVRALGKAKLIENPAKLIKAHGEGLHRMQGAALRTDLEGIARYVGPFVVAPDVDPWMEAWYKQHITVDLPALPEVMQDGYGSRKHTMVYKVAMSLSVARNQWPHITLPIVQESVRLVTALEEPMSQIMQKIGIAQHAQQADKIIGMLRLKSATCNELMARGAFNLVQDVWMLDKLLRSMVAARLIERTGDGRYVPVVFGGAAAAAE